MAKPSWVKKISQYLGPGFITGASDDDPSGIATYAQTGAQFGYQQLWTAFFVTPFMAAMQEMCGRIGLVTGKGLAGVMRAHYRRSLLYGAVALLLFANMVNIGADLAAMAASVQLLLGGPTLVWLVLIAVIILLLEIFIVYHVYAKYLKYLALSLLAYVVTAFVVQQDWGRVFTSTVVPHLEFSGPYLLNLVAILGTTISPYLFFWQADEEVEEEVLQHKLRTMGQGVPRVTRADVRREGWDTAIGMILSNIIMFFIIMTAASTIFASHGPTTITSATQAAEMLRPIAGNLSYVLFMLGIVGTGFLAVPIFAGSASYAVAELAGWREGLYRKFRQARGFYGVMAISTLVGVLVNFTPLSPFQMLYYAAVLNGLLAPPLMVLIILIANRSDIMGQYVNTRTSNALGWFITAVMGACALALLAYLV